MSPDTIRHYERIGVLPRASRTQAGYRVYPASAIETVLVVQRALRVGFTLAELAEVLKARDAGGVPCRRVYQLAQDKLKDIEAEIEALKRTRTVIAFLMFGALQKAIHEFLRFQIVDHQTEDISDVADAPL